MPSLVNFTYPLWIKSFLYVFVILFCLCYLHRCFALVKASCMKLYYRDYAVLIQQKISIILDVFIGYLDRVDSRCFYNERDICIFSCSSLCWTFYLWRYHQQHQHRHRCRRRQCDQMAFIVFIICQFVSMKYCPIVFKISRSR